ncbi:MULTISPECIES: hypothetical protein [unclassified Methanoculleus]|uniref:Uncharacterized protein n=1 Tax=Methanoculleus palmolei TaxID=72612 RepID=A0ABD8AB17_9EURY|nr:hypothetical protein [Methanoculleus sp. UBA377]MDD2472947.1 hypothetical protein [Methanoculleus sp.]WOX55781.1 hypothetical protein R6Y95_00225 [Methanoculleus palmolei]
MKFPIPLVIGPYGLTIQRPRWAIVGTTPENGRGESPHAGAEAASARVSNPADRVVLAGRDPGGLFGEGNVVATMLR